MTRFSSNIGRCMLLGLALASLLGCSGDADELGSTVQGSDWVQVAPRLLEQRLGLVGRLQSVEQTTLAAPFDGLIAEVRVEEGQYVEKGQVLISLNPAQLQVQQRQAQVELLKARREAQRLEHWRDSPEVARARRAVATARQTLASSEGNLRDTQALFERGIVARMEVQSLAQQVDTQRQDLAAASQELATTLAYGLGEERSIAAMELANAEARHQALEALYARREIFAPLAGHVVRPRLQDGGKPVPLQSGIAVTQGTPLIGVIGQERFQALTRVEETDLHLLHEGMAVQISGDGFSGELSGNISALGIQSETTETQGAGAQYEVKVKIDPPAQPLQQPMRAGMSARLSIILQRNEQAIALPPQALRDDERGGRYLVYRATPQAEVERITVTTLGVVPEGVVVQGLGAGFVEVPRS
ncbi:MULTISPECIES: efflux RND transporter periplasmic adaptor subunit [Pseudomonas]|uniref:HlyD family efflux transporter periplasmic adaptor subunit n=1 Tax=Pseudomonas mosselii TaxID=78327 RepID=A0A5R8ZBA1_9PSED|nr:biotin/lipoyl-binding protein [Pseudomonas mosselii]TLP63098.1 HlyD family efflux transporter periplasmic adaptor subunit [Pseudomonas mosselii]